MKLTKIFLIYLFVRMTGKMLLAPLFLLTSWGTKRSADEISAANSLLDLLATPGHIQETIFDSRGASSTYIRGETLYTSTTSVRCRIAYHPEYQLMYIIRPKYLWHSSLDIIKAHNEVARMGLGPGVIGYSRTLYPLNEDRDLPFTATPAEWDELRNQENIILVLLLSGGASMTPLSRFLSRLSPAKAVLVGEVLISNARLMHTKRVHGAITAENIGVSTLSNASPRVQFMGLNTSATSKTKMDDIADIITIVFNLFEETRVSTEKYEELKTELIKAVEEGNPDEPNYDLITLRLMKISIHFVLRSLMRFAYFLSQ
jgi:hypothetical protein